MKKQRQENTFVVRIWREPSDLIESGEWRGTIRQLGESQEQIFKEPQELWEYLTMQLTLSNISVEERINNSS